MAPPTWRQIREVIGPYDGMVRSVDSGGADIAIGGRGSALIVCGFRIVPFPSAAALVEAVRSERTILVALNAEKLSRGDPQVREIVNRNVGYADGYGAALAIRRKGGRSARIAGADLWLELARTYADSRSFYLVGSTTEVIERTVAKLLAEFPDLKVVGFRDGFMRAQEQDALAAELVELRPDVVFVAMGSPRQEYLMDRLFKAWPAVYVGLGGSFDIYVGVKPRAPRLVQRFGLEWLFRLVVDPSRLPRLPSYLGFAWRLVLGRL